LKTSGLNHMKTAILFLTLGLVSLFFLHSETVIGFGRATVDLHIHDTYIIINTTHVVIGVLLYLTTLFAFGGAVGNGFRKRFFNLLLLICILAIALLVWLTYYLLTS
jgi:hypothetical protein